MNHVVEVTVRSSVDPRAPQTSLYEMFLDGALVRQQISYLGAEDVATELANRRLSPSAVKLRPLPPEDRSGWSYQGATHRRASPSSLLPLPTETAPFVPVAVAPAEVRLGRSHWPATPAQRRVLRLLLTHPPQIPNGRGELVDGVPISALALLLNTLERSVRVVVAGLVARGLATREGAGDPVVVLTPAGAQAAGR